MKENTFDEISSWITVSIFIRWQDISCLGYEVRLYDIEKLKCIFFFFFYLLQENVGSRVKDPKFIRTLMTAILETSIGIYC